MDNNIPNSLRSNIRQLKICIYVMVLVVVSIKFFFPTTFSGVTALRFKLISEIHIPFISFFKFVRQ